MYVHKKVNELTLYCSLSSNIIGRQVLENKFGVLKYISELCNSDPFFPSFFLAKQQSHLQSVFGKTQPEDQ